MHFLSEYTALTLLLLTTPILSAPFPATSGTSAGPENANHPTNPAVKKWQEFCKTHPQACIMGEAGQPVNKVTRENKKDDLAARGKGKAWSLDDPRFNMPDLCEKHPSACQKGYGEPENGIVHDNKKGSVAARGKGKGKAWSLDDPRFNMPDLCEKHPSACQKGYGEPENDKNKKGGPIAREALNMADTAKRDAPVEPAEPLGEEETAEEKRSMSTGGKSQVAPLCGRNSGTCRGVYDSEQFDKNIIHEPVNEF